MQFIRQTAIPCTLVELKEGAWLAEEPTGVQSPRGKVSRANILGVVVEKEGNTVTIDDGSTTLKARSFDSPPKSEVGDMVLVIGRPREYNGERYIALEICKSLKNKGWVDYRKKELEIQGTLPVAEPPKKEEQVEEVPVVDENKITAEDVLNKIRKLDKEGDATTEEVLSSLKNSENILNSLMEEGDVFEIKPGVLKVLE